MGKTLLISRVTGNHQVRDMLKEIASKHSDQLSTWEAGFIKNLTKGTYNFSDKQWATAARLVEKHLGWTIKEA